MVVGLVLFEHAQDDFEPFVGEFAQGRAVPVAVFAASMIVVSGPGAVVGARKGEEVEHVSPVLFASAPDTDVAPLSALLLDGRNPGHAAKGLVVFSGGRDHGQCGRQAFAGAGQGLDQLVLRQALGALFDEFVEGVDVGLEGEELRDGGLGEFAQGQVLGRAGPREEFVAVVDALEPAGSDADSVFLQEGDEGGFAGSRELFGFGIFLKEAPGDRRGPIGEKGQEAGIIAVERVLEP